MSYDPIPAVELCPYRVLAYADADGWNLRGTYPTLARARQGAADEGAEHRLVAVVKVAGPHVEVVQANAPNPTRLLAAAGFRAAATAL